MPQRLLGIALAAFLFPLGLASQAPALQYAPAEPLPSDRAADTYTIYSQLLPGNAIEWGDAPRTQWLLEDVTNALPLGEDCSKDGMMNPHTAIKAPKERQADFAELLADFDASCHVRYRIDGTQIRVKLPIRMLDEAARKRYTAGVMHYVPPANDIMRAPATPDEFKGAAGMHSFTAVFFNKSHSLAMTEIGMYCGGLCGNFKWVVLARKDDGSWHSLPWVFSTVFF